MFQRIVDRLSLGLSILALAVAITGFYYAWQGYRQAKETDQSVDAGLSASDNVSAEQASLDAQIALDEVERIQSQAQNASNSAETILGFIESGSIMIAALIALGAVVFGLSIQDVRARLDGILSQSRDVLSTSESQVKALEADMRIQLDAAVKADEERLKDSQQQFADLTLKIEDALQRTEGRVNSFEEVIHGAVNSAKADAEVSFRVLSLLLLAEQQVRARNRETAINTLEEAVKLDPNNQPANYLLGYLYVGRKQFAKAVEHLQRALDQNPNFAPALAAMGLAQSRMADQEKENMMHRNQLRAQSEYNLSKALESDPDLMDADNESYFGTLGGLYRRQGRDQEAMQAYEQAVKVTPNNSYPVGNLAVLYKKLNHEEQAQLTYKKVIEIAEAILDDHPGDIWARLDLAQAYLITGDKKKAISHYKNVFERITSPGPLESALSVLKSLKDAATPIDGIDEVVELMQAEIAQEKAGS